jgi:predicted unusual protein kinase regulating ubiquinone biosynthesis (AarF/ABC1/UbiB family)
MGIMGPSAFELLCRKMRPAEQAKGDLVARALAEAPADQAPDDSSIEAAIADSESQMARACRPPARTWRSLRAYWVTFVVIASYLSVRVQARFRSDDAIQRLLSRKHRANAGRIERAIVHLQGLYIKVGQLISIMTNFLPPEFRAQLEDLQDQVPPRPYEDMERRIREEFGGRSPDELFQSFDRRPIASASIGQVHLARLAGGQRVAVKVQYPDIEEIVRSDLRTLRRIFRIVQSFVPYKGLEDVYREIRAMLHAELDFRAEADNLERIASNFTGREDVAFPLVVRPLSTQRVLTTHFESGIKVGDLPRIDRAGIDRAEVARMVVELYCQQIFSDGVYHADPHPGNLLIRRRPAGALQVVFLDFGAVAEVSPQMRQGLVELLQGALGRDTPRIVRAMKQMGFIARGAEDGVFDRVIEYFHGRFQEQISLDSLSLKDIKFDPQKGLENLADLRRMDISLRELSSNFHVPKEWILLERTLLLLMGLCTALDPHMNPMTVVRPYLERFVLGEEGSWQGFAVETAKDLLLSLTALPSDIHKLVGAAKTGELSVRFQNLEKSTRLLYRLGHQAITAAVGIAGAAIAVVLEGRGEIERAEYGWWTARIAAVLLLWSWWTSRHFLRKR